MAQKRPISAAEGWAREVGASAEAAQDASQAALPVGRPRRSPCRSAGPRIRFGTRKDKRAGEGRGEEEQRG